MKSAGMKFLRSVRFRGFSLALVLLSTCACTDSADHNVTVTDGEAAALPCQCLQDPPLYLVWQKAVGEQQLLVNYYAKEDNKTMEPEYRNRTELKGCSLLFNSVHPSDRGLYKCYYQISPLRHDNIYLEVKEKPEKVSIGPRVQNTVTAVCGILVIVITVAAVYVGIACKRRRKMNGTFVATSARDI